jgi:sugar lactone lactonase YvrE
MKTHVLLSGLAFGESGRWHDDRFWFAHWGTGEIAAVDMDGHLEVMAKGRAGLGWSIDWLPDGRLLVTGESLIRQEMDGTMVQHADLTQVAEHGWNEIVVDGRGNIYLNGFGFDFLGGGAPEPGIVALVTPDGRARQVADDIQFPNGMVVTPDNSTLIVSESFAGRLTAFDIEDDGSLSNRRIWADGIGPDGICIDADGAVWTSSGRKECIGVREGGEIVDRIPVGRDIFSVMLGGPDGRTLFILAAEWRGVDQVEQALADRTGQLLVAEAPAPGAGYP